MKSCSRCRSHYPDEVTACPRHHGPLVTVDDPHLHRVLSGCRIESFLREGGMGLVYRARQLELGRDVAVKILRPDLTGHFEVRKRFRAEAQAIARLKHPHIVDIIDLGETASGQLYFVLELLEGVDLHHRLHAGPPLAVAAVTSLCRQTLSALAFAHRSAVIHRDLKPSNIFLARVGGYADWVKLLDFGVAKIKGLAAAQRTSAGLMLGTPGHMAPEQVEGREVDPRSDIYSFGTVLFELCTGQRPFGEDDPRQILARQAAHPRPRLTLDPARGFPPRIAAVIERCLAPAPADRYDSVEDLALSLGQALGVELDVGGGDDGAAAVVVGPPIPSEIVTTPHGRALPSSAPGPVTALDPAQRARVVEHRSGSSLAALDAPLPAGAGARPSGPATALDAPQRARVVEHRSRSRRRRRAGLWIAAALVGVAAVTLLATLLLLERDRTPHPTGAIAPPPVERCRGEACTARARQILVSTLEGGAPGARVEALRAIGRLGLVSLSASTATRLRDGDLAVRCAAAEALGRLADPTQRRAIAEARRDPAPLLQVYLDEALWRLGDDDALGRLAQSLSAADRAARVRAIHVLSLMADRRALQLLETEARGSERGDLALLLLKQRARQGDGQALARLQGLLAIDDKLTRSAAAQALLELGDAVARRRLTDWLSDPQTRLDAACLLAHGGLGDGRQALIEGANGPSARLALQALARIPSLTARRAAEPALDSADPETRVAAAEVVLSSSTEVSAQSQLDWVRFALGSPVARVRVTATELLALAPTDASLPLLARAIDDQAPEVRSRAAHVLGRTTTEEAISLLTKATRDEATAVREAAVRALGENARPNAVPALLTALADSGSVGLWAAGSLLRLGRDDGLALLRGAVRRGDEARRLTAARALAEARSRRALPVLRELLRSTDAAVRLEAAAGLAWLRDRSGLTVLQAALSEGAERSATAIAALARLGHPAPELRAALGRLARSTDPAARLAALRAAAESDSTTAIERIAAGLRDVRVEVRREAALLLGRSLVGQHPSRERLLLLALQDADAAVRTAAGFSLVQRPAPASRSAEPARQAPDAGPARPTKGEPRGAPDLAARRRQALLAKTTGEVLLAQGRFEVALGAFERAQRLDPRLELDLEVGDLYRRRAATRKGQSAVDDLRRAATHYRRATALEEQTPRGRRASSMLQVVTEALARTRARDR